MRSITLAVLLTTSGLFAGCSFDAVTDKVNPYRIDIRQGNYVDQTMVSQLKKGMTREQVRYVLGTPLVVDGFRQDRWDYVYLFRPGKGQAEKRTLSLFFAEGLLDSIEGDVIAAGDAPAEAAMAPERSRVIEISPAAGKK